MAKIISEETIERVRTESNLPQLFSDYTKVDQRGPDDFWCCCPFHNEKTPSCKITPSRAMFYCFGCHAGGNSITFVKEMEKISFPEAVESLAKRFNIPVVYKNGSNDYKKDDGKSELKKNYIELYSRLAITFHYFLTQTPQGKSALDYILKRGLSIDTIEKFKIGYSPADGYWLRKFLKEKNYSREFLTESGLFCKNNDNFAFFHNRLMFPIFNKNGEVVAFGGRILEGEGPKYLNSGNLIQYQKGETLFAFNFAKKTIQLNKSVILCEGYMDCIAYHQCGFTNAVAPLGTALTEDQVKLIKGFVKTVYLSFDSDDAGQNATFKAILLLRSLGLEDIRVIVLKGGKDPAEIMLNYGIETLTNDVNNAILDSDFLLNSLAKKYGSTSDGKFKACMQYFQYIDILPSAIQKTSTLEKLSGAYHIPLESVLEDFNNRKAERQKTEPRRLFEKQNSDEKVDPVNINAELRFMLALAVHPENFSDVRSKVGLEDLENPWAKDLYNTLEELFRQNELSTNAVAGHYAETNKEMNSLIAKSTLSGEFDGIGSQAAIDGIESLIQKRLKKRKLELNMQLRDAEFSHNSELVESLLIEITQIDNKIKKLKV